MLGAHMFAKHKGESKDYKHKMEVWNARKDERALLVSAKCLFYALHPNADHRKERGELN